MSHYYFNRYLDKNGNHEVHKENCSFLPSFSNRISIGYCSSCSDAISKAKLQTGISNFDGCFYCSNLCHKG